MDDGLSDLMRIDKGRTGKALLIVPGGLERANPSSFNHITPGGIS